jgi:hypothetical protein
LSPASHGSVSGAVSYRPECAAPSHASHAFSCAWNALCACSSAQSGKCIRLVRLGHVLDLAWPCGISSTRGVRTLRSHGPGAGGARRAQGPRVASAPCRGRKRSPPQWSWRRPRAPAYKTETVKPGRIGPRRLRCAPGPGWERHALTATRPLPRAWLRCVSVAGARAGGT